MGELTFLMKMKGIIGSISFKIFLYCSDMTQEVYLDLIYEQEKRERGDN